MRKEKPDFFRKAADCWLPFLKEEIEEFENVPVLPLGEPVLNCLMMGPDWHQIRYYWGFEGPGKYGGTFDFVPMENNILRRILFPFPHLPGLSREIYRLNMKGYL
ncbi:MAG: hypothetical protein KKB53_00960, partial [Acidobacteria bacterium]|nr:hypothetical protein [Acidobacteriota bacterium]